MCLVAEMPVAGGYGQRGWFFRNQPYALDSELRVQTAGPGSAMAELIDAIEQGRAHLADGVEGLTITRLLDTIYRNAAEGQPLAINRTPGTSCPG